MCVDVVEDVWDILPRETWASIVSSRGNKTPSKLVSSVINANEELETLRTREPDKEALQKPHLQIAKKVVQENAAVSSFPSCEKIVASSFNADALVFTPSIQSKQQGQDAIDAADDVASDAPTISNEQSQVNALKNDCRILEKELQTLQVHNFTFLYFDHHFHLFFTFRRNIWKSGIEVFHPETPFRKENN